MGTTQKSGQTLPVTSGHIQTFPVNFQTNFSSHLTGIYKHFRSTSGHNFRAHKNISYHLPVHKHFLSTSGYIQTFLVNFQAHTNISHQLMDTSAWFWSTSGKMSITSRARFITSRLPLPLKGLSLSVLTPCSQYLNNISCYLISIFCPAINSGKNRSYLEHLSHLQHRKAVLQHFSIFAKLSGDYFCHYQRLAQHFLKFNHHFQSTFSNIGS